MRPSKNLKKSLANLLTHLEWTDEVEAFLASRGVTREAAAQFDIGGVPHDLSGWHEYGGMLAMPYMTATGALNVKFRALDEKKYMNLPSATAGLYNAKGLLEPSDLIVICEGELDAVVMQGVCGIPAVAVAGVNNWKPWHGRCFDGHQHVLIATDNDDREDGKNPGKDLARRIVKDVPHAVITMPPKGMDITDLYLRDGVMGVTDALGITEGQ